MTSHAYILSLDLGTTGNRAIVFDKKQNIVCQFYEEFPQIFPKPGWVEHDADQIWRSVERILRKTFRRVPIQRIAGVGVTNQRETVVLWDRHTGKPVHHAIVWQDRRTAEACKRLKKKGLEKKIHAKTGLFLDPYFSASKIAWLLEHVPGLRARVRARKILAGTIDTWVIWKLSRGKFHVTDVSNASRTLLFNIKSLRWDKDLARFFGVPTQILPKVVASSGSLAAVDKSLFGRELPITGIAGDQQAAAFAQGCFAPGIVKNTYGTGLFAVESTGKQPRFSKNLLTTVAWSLKSIKNVTYAVEGSVFIGGAAIQWMRDGLGLIRNARETEAICRRLTSNGGVYFVPALAGLGAPYWDAYARGTIIGITRGTTREHFVRAAVEAIAYQTRDILEVMKKDTRHGFKKLQVDGGASANNFLMQFQSDLLGIPVERPEILETTALGAAALAGIAVGYWKDAKQFYALKKIDRVFKPRNKKAEMDRFYSRWKKGVERSLLWEDV